MPRVKLPNEFVYRPYQKAAIKYFERGGKRAITIWHRRAGKDLTAAHYTCMAAHEHLGQYWHFFPSFELARRAIWEGFRADGKRLLENVFPGFTEPKRQGSIVRRKNDAQMFLELKCGSIWRLIGSDRVENVGAGPKGVVFSEFALCKPTAWDYIRPMLRESNGWAWFILTPRGSGVAKELYDQATPESGWYRDLKTVLDTNITYSSSTHPGQTLNAVEMMAEERAEGMADALIRQEYLCEWNASNLGSIYGDLIEKLEHGNAIEAFDYEPTEVYTAWDLGISDDTSIIFWRLVDGRVQVIDHYANHGKALDHYFEVLDAKKYSYAMHWLPHDANARTLATGLAIIDQFRNRYGGAKVRIGPSLSLMDGIQASRWLLQQPGLKFHGGHTKALIQALKHYAYKFDEDKRAFSMTPDHSWASHSADAWRYLAIVTKVTADQRKPSPKDEKPKPKLITEVRPGVYQLPYTLDDCYADHTRRTGRPERY